MKKRLISIVSFVMAVLVFTSCLSAANATNNSDAESLSQYDVSTIYPSTTRADEIYATIEHTTVVYYESTTEHANTTIPCGSTIGYETTKSPIEEELGALTTAVKEDILASEPVVTRAPGQTVVDDAEIKTTQKEESTTKKPAAVDTEIPSTGGDTESIFDKIMNFFRKLIMSIVEFLIMITDAVTSGFEFLIGLI